MIWNVLGYVALAVMLVAGLFAVSYALAICDMLFPSPKVESSDAKSDWEHERGAKVITVPEAQAQVHERFGNDFSGMYLANCLKLPMHTYHRHVMVTGSTGSGKGIVFQCLMKEALRKKIRIISFDPDGSYLSGLTGYCRDSTQLVYFQPFDSRSLVYTPWRDYKRVSYLDNLVNFIVRMDKAVNDPFWPAKARSVLRAVLAELVIAESEFEWVDVLQLTKTAKRIKALLKHGGRAVSVIEDLDGPKKMVKGILATLDSNLSKLDGVAAVQSRWNSSKRRFSITGLMRHTKDPKHLVMGYSERHREPVQVIHAVLGQKIANEIMTQGSPENPTMWFIDEIAAFGEEFGEVMLQLLPYGRKYGLILVAATQSRSVLDAAWKNPKLVDAFLGCMGTSVYLSQTCTVGREHGSKDLGTAEVYDVDESTGTSYSLSVGRERSESWGSSKNTSKKRSERRCVLGDELKGLCEPTPNFPFIEGHIGSGAFRDTAYFKSEFIEELKDWQKPDRKNYELDPAHEILGPWTKEAIIRLKLPQATTDALLDVLLQEEMGDA